MEMNWWMNASAWILPVVIAVTMHEAAHGWMAARFGDSTATRAGRVTFNPLKHIDRFGTVMMPAMLLLVQSPFVFGYAKPVPVNFRQLQPQRLGMVLVALAGPGTNILLALICALLLYVDRWVTPEQAPWLFMNLYRGLIINCALAVFNMIPVLPLDGGRVVDALLPKPLRAWYGKLERFGMLVVIALLFVPAMFGYGQAMQWLSVPVYWTLEHILWLTGNNG
jgi:Zn-dependent protease